MATSQTKNGMVTIHAAVERFTERGEQVLATARKAGKQYLDSYEKTVDRTIDLELKAAGATDQEWLKSLIEGQAELTRELTRSYTAAARTILK
jgi:DNA uptake protein ComE-like DNA-binding protein